MSKPIRSAAALGLAITLFCFITAPVAAAPAPLRAEEPPRASVLDLSGLADHLADLFEGWLRSVFSPSGVAGDPNG